MNKHYRQQVMEYPRYTSTALTRRRREILYGAARACRFRTRIGTSTNPITLTTRTASICMLSTKMARGTTTNATSLCLQFAKEVRSMAHTCDIMYIFICVAYARLFTLSHLSSFASLSLKKWLSQKYFTLFLISCGVNGRLVLPSKPITFLNVFKTHHKVSLKRFENISICESETF